MPPIGPIKRPKFIHYLKQLGWTDPKPGGNHQYMVSPNGALKIHVPNPHQGDIGDNLLSKLLKQAGIERADWEALK